MSPRTLFILLVIVGSLTCTGFAEVEANNILGSDQSEATILENPPHFNEAVTLPTLDSSPDTCKIENEELLLRLERLESIFNVSQFNPDLDDVSLMELMYMSVKEKVFTSIPSTDEQCDFDFITGKCAPFCSCEFKPRFGDYNPSRMCRLIPTERIDNDCDPSKRLTPWAVELVKYVKNTVGFILTSTMKTLREKAPPTDSECKFSIPLMLCIPSNKCVLDYQFGDYSPHRSCRYKIDQIGNGQVDTPRAKSKQELVGIS